MAHFVGHLRQLVRPPGYDLQTDAALLDLFNQHHDQAAFETLVARHGPMVHRHCRRVTSNGTDADDAFQAVFLVLARRASAIRRPESLAAWLHGVAYRVAQKARGGRPDTCEYATEQADHHPDPSDELTARELLTILDQEIQRLPEAYRLPIILCYLEGRTQEEAARLLGWTPGSVKGRLERARSQLHTRLTRRGLTLSAALAALGLTQGPLTAKVPVSLQLATVSGIVTAKSASLADAVMKGASITKLKLVVGLLLMTGGLGTTMCVLERPLPADKQPEVLTGAQRTLRLDHSEERATILKGHRAPVGTLVFSPDGTLLASADSSHTTRVWDMTTNEVLCTCDEYAYVTHMAFSPDGRFLVSNLGNGIVRYRDVTRGMLDIVTFLNERPISSNSSRPVSVRRQIQTASISSMAFSPDGKQLLLCDVEGRVGAWDLDFKKWTRSIKFTVPVEDRTACTVVGVIGTSIVGLTGSPLGQGPLLTASYLARANTQFVGSWAPAGGESEQRPASPYFGLGPRHMVFPLGVFGAAFSPDCQFLAWDDTEGLTLWHVDSGLELWTTKGQWEPYRRLVFSPDGRHLASASVRHQTARLWDAATGQPLKVQRHSEGFCSVAFSPDGQFLALATRSSVLLWDIATGQEYVVLRMEKGQVRCLAFSPDGARLAVAIGQDVHLCDVSRYRPMRP
jgi:RNA polymerase sigma factor (sigma-70 family)